MRTRTRAAKVAEDAPDEEITQLISEVQKQYGDHGFYLARHAPRFSTISTGIFLLDMALLGGIPENLITMVYGERSSGKTTLAAKVVASAQKKHIGSRCAWLDIEGTLDTAWIAKHGVDVDKLYLSEPETGEHAVDLAHAIIGTKGISLLVIDSIAALTPYKEIEASAEDALVGQQSRLVARMIRTCVQRLIAERHRGHKITLILINQFRMKIGGFILGDPRTLPGGKALEYATSAQILMRNKEETGKDDLGIEMVDHNKHSFTITKNKLGNSIRNGEFRMIRNPDNKLGEGFIDDSPDLVTYAKKFGLLSGGGKNQTIDGVKGAKGKMEDLVRFLNDNKVEHDRLARKLVALQRERMGVTRVG